MISLMLVISQINIIVTSVTAVLTGLVILINVFLIKSIFDSRIKYKSDPYIYVKRETKVQETVDKKKNKSRRERKEEKRLKRLEKEQRKIIQVEVESTHIEEPSKDVKEESVEVKEEHIYLSPETPMFDQVFFKKTEAPDTNVDLDDDLNHDIEGKITFEKKLATTSMENKVLYNALKNHIMEYRNIKGRVVNGGEYFRYPGKQIIKIILIGKVLRMAIALDSKDYDYNIYHQKDRSAMKKYQETPMFVKVNSRLGLLRANQLVDDVMKKLEVKKKKSYDYVDYARELTDEVMLKEQEQEIYSTEPIN